ncbi:hypothetical protein [Xanthocytophaga agilis]|uniref:Uncharacterized protein n=1 Tax=Xanthocytophaga agilis TaxID=3048010 RepID=A0AAE3R4J5_9BACT|nr:hypothetical protein [Xanthocytophaga agilis]MDJ1503496.1 hypothetical protein [Xanthocytophaga agilis]
MNAKKIGLKNSNDLLREEIRRWIYFIMNGLLSISLICFGAIELYIPSLLSLPPYFEDHPYAPIGTGLALISGQSIISILGQVGKLYPLLKQLLSIYKLYLKSQGVEAEDSEIIDEEYEIDEGIKKDKVASN